MDFGEVIKGLKEGKKYWRTSIAKNHWLELKNNRFIINNKIGKETKYNSPDADLLATDWEEVKDTKIAKVDVTRVIMFEGVCPSCQTGFSISKTDLKSSKDIIITCTNCGLTFGINKEEEKVSDEIFKTVEVK
jgi:Fe2+ or Zn2+ uptake regulation protein